MRYQLSETIYVAQQFFTGQTVTVELVNLSTGALTALDAGTAAEASGLDGLFIWDTTDITTPPAVSTQYVVVMTESTSGRQKMSKIVVGGYLENLDAAITTIASAIAALNDISTADILADTLGSGETVDVAMSRLDNMDALLTSLNSFLLGGREIDFAGNDALGWQRVERNEAAAEVARYNLLDEDGNRITGTVAAFILATKMISSEVKV